MREKSIDGKIIKNAIGFCHYETHPGALNRELASKHKCVQKKMQALGKVQRGELEAKASI